MLTLFVLTIDGALEVKDPLHLPNLIGSVTATTAAGWIIRWVWVSCGTYSTVAAAIVIG